MKMTTLNCSYRDVLRMKVDRYSAQQIAAITGVPLGSIMKYVSPGFSKQLESLARRNVMLRRRTPKETKQTSSTNQIESKLSAEVALYMRLPQSSRQVIADKLRMLLLQEAAKALPQSV